MCAMHLRDAAEQSVQKPPPLNPMDEPKNITEDCFILGGTQCDKCGVDDHQTLGDLHQCLSQKVITLLP